MALNKENKIKLKEFFNKEYHSLTIYVNSKIKANVNRNTEDIIQDVALKLLSGADRYSPINNVAGFVYSSIKNKIVDVLRENKKKNVPINEYEEKLVKFSELLNEKPDNSYSDEMIDKLKDAIKNLKPFYRDIIIAVDFENYTYKEISEETGISIGTLMSRRHRAISMLYKELGPKKEV